MPSEQLRESVPWLSQNCSFRITKPIPGNSTTVLGLGAALTGVPCTTSPRNSVPLASEAAPVAFAALLELDFTSVALIPHPVCDDRRHTPEARAKLAAELVSVVSVPLLSLCEAPAATAPEICTCSRLWLSSPPLGGMLTKPTVVGTSDGSVAALATNACPLTVWLGGMAQSSVCGKSVSATALETITSSGWFPGTRGRKSVANTWIMFTFTSAVKVP